MITRSRVLRFVSIFAMLAVLGGGAIALLPLQDSSAAQTGYTPIPRVLTVVSADPQTTTWTSSTFQWNDPAGHYAQTTPTEADIFLHLTMPISNTATFVLQVSADMVNWVDHATLGTALVTDTNSITTLDTVGRFFRIAATTVISSDTYTSTIYAVLRRDDVPHPGTP